jgi:hypothetical protein
MLIGATDAAMAMIAVLEARSKFRVIGIPHFNFFQAYIADKRRADGRISFSDAVANSLP